MSLYMQDNLDKFIKGADAPVKPFEFVDKNHESVYILAPRCGVDIKTKGLKFDLKTGVEIDKEWVKRLLEEYEKCICEDYRNVAHAIYPKGEEFLEKSEVWNGKDN